MIRTILFDLFDVLVVGLTGIEEQLHPRLGVPKDDILPQFRSQAMLDFLLGQCSEETYLQTVRHEYGWKLNVEQIKPLLRAHFKQVVPGAEEIVGTLARQYVLILLSAQGREWGQYVEQAHPFLALFQRRFYTYELRMQKDNPQVYRQILSEMGAQPEECLFIDDRQVFLNAARTVGLHTLQFENSAQLRTQLMARYSIRV